MSDLLKIVKAQGSSALLKITCKGCDIRLPWNEAAEKGWKYSPKGTPYNAFYCQPCQSKS